VDGIHVLHTSDVSKVGEISKSTCWSFDDLTTLIKEQKLLILGFDLKNVQVK